MTITAPVLDFSMILLEMGQLITIRTITRTVDANGMVTATTITDLDTTAQISEVGWKEKTFLTAGLVNIGDIMFFVAPSTVINIYDKIVWNSTTYSIRKILMPPRIAGTLLFQQILTVRDSA